MEEADANQESAASARKQEEQDKERPRTSRALALYCENLREAGTLVAVFASLDALFSTVRVSAWVAGWILVGLGMLYIGVRIDPEVRK